MTRMPVALAIVALGATTGLADDPQNTLVNPGFETPDPTFPFVPYGWGDIPLNDPLWTTDQARSGTMSIGLPPASVGSFIGWTTNIFDENGDLFDPPFEYGGGDLVLTGYYNIPVGEELNPDDAEPPLDVVGVKLELRRVPPNFSIYQAFEFTIDVSTTNGEWVPFEARVTPDMVGDFENRPESVAVLPFRFNTGNGWQGVIYWDDLCVFQLGACAADMNGDTVLDIFDVLDYLALFDAGDSAADLNGDTVLDIFDVLEYLALFDAGC